MRKSIGYLAIIVCIFCLTGQAIAQNSNDCNDAKAQVTRLESRLKDWPAISRYHDANSTVAPVEKNEARVVFMGDRSQITGTNPDSEVFSQVVLISTEA